MADELKASNTTASLNVKIPQQAKEGQPGKRQEKELKERPSVSMEADQELSLLRLETERIKLKREILELERLESDIAAIRLKKEKSTMSHDTVEEALRFGREHDEWHQTACTHLKGGSSESLLGGAPSKGNDSGNYCLIDHTMTQGIRYKICQRCGKTWFPGDFDYRWAMSRPSKNSPSTGCPSPGLVRNRKHQDEGGPRMTSEIPHKVAPIPESPFGPGPAGY